MTNKSNASINKVKSLQQVNTLVKAIFTIIEGQTGSGKKCFSALSDLRLSIEDFKSLMHDITLAGGYGFTKFYPEHKTKLISVTGIDEGLFRDLLNQYTWNKPEPKQPKTKAPKEAKQAAVKDMGLSPADLELFKQFKVFQAMQAGAK